VSAERIGERPCMGDIDILKVDNLCQKCKSVIEPIIGREVTYISSSTDCNIPLSLGVPAACIGVYYGDGMHTREEWVEKSSLPIGLEVCIKTLLAII
ncbi:MAG: peptidase, partial [Clostridia bacterium]|nr:peptidase [Clostridia bacterium]